MKKIASLVGAGALLFSMVAPSFAFFDFLSDDISIRNYGRVSNDIEVEAETGDNEIHGFWVFGGSINTGGAEAAGLVTNIVNTTTTGGGLE